MVRERRHRHRRRRRNYWPRILVAAGVALVGLFLAWRMPPPRWAERWPAPDTGFTPWQPLFRGVDYARANLTSPRLMKCHALRLDLAAAGLGFMANPAIGGGPGRVRSWWPSDFLRANGLQVVVNTTPFMPETPVPGVPVTLQGLSISSGRLQAPPASNLDALVIDRDGRAHFVASQAEYAEARTACGGFLIILKGGVVTAERLPPDAAMTAGASADGRYLYFLAVDGRQPGYSEGATPGETAGLLLGLGAVDGINFDGGSSAVMAVEGGWRGARILNRPCSILGGGWERPIGGLLGIYAQHYPHKPAAAQAAEPVASAAHL